MAKSSRNASTCDLPSHKRSSKSFEQIAHGRLLDAPTLSGAAERWGIGGQPTRQQLVVADDQRGALGGGQAGLTLRARLLGRGAHLDQQRFEVFGPRLLVLFGDKGQFAQMVDVAERMATGGLRLIGLPAVVDTYPAIVGQDANGVGRRAPALSVNGVNGIVGQPRGTRHMRPGQPPTPPHAGLIAVQHRRPVERRFESCFHRFDHLSALLDPLHQRPQ